MRALALFCGYSFALILFGQSGRNFGLLFSMDGSLNPYSRTDIHDMANSLTDSSIVVQVDSAKGGNFGFTLMFVVENITIEFGMSTIPTYVIGNGDFSAKYTTFGNNTSVKTDSLDLFMMFSHLKIGAGYMFNNGGTLFIAPSLNYDSEVGRMVLKDRLWQQYDNNNHYTYTTTSNGVHIDSLHQDKSKVRGVSLGLRTGVLVGRGWKSGLGMMLSVAPYIKYGWRANTNLYGQRVTDPGRWSFYSVISLGVGVIRKN